MATVEQTRLRGERRIVLSGVPWKLYEQLRQNERNWHVQMAYDNGRLELMSPSRDHHHRICQLTEIDPAVDPPPDLAVETEISRGALSKPRIYAALGVPEVWRWRKKGLTAYSLGTEGKYVEREFSLNLPQLKVTDLDAFLDFQLAADETSWIRQFRAWVTRALFEAIGSQRDSLLGKRSAAC